MKWYFELETRIEEKHDYDSKVATENSRPTILNDLADMLRTSIRYSVGSISYEATPLYRLKCQKCLETDCRDLTRQAKSPN